MVNILGDRKAFLAREITKLHEEYIRGNLSDILKTLEEKEVIKGECSLFVQGQLEQKTIDEEQLEKIIISRLATTDLGTSDLARQISNEFKVSKKQVYATILKLNQSDS
jgi:16S rRNA (cytidine1402-2'-O)-methyltransferase